MTTPVSYANVVDLAFPAPSPTPKASCKSFSQTITKPFVVTVDVFKKSFANTNALDKTAKMIVSILRLTYDIALNIFKTTLGPLKLVMEEMGALVSLISGLNFISRLSEWVGRKNGKRYWENNSPAKVTSYALITTAHGIEACLFFQSLGLVKFGKFVQFLASIPILGLIVRVPAKVIKDLFVVGSAIFGIKANLQSYQEAKNELKKVKTEHIDKWQRRLDEMSPNVVTTDEAKEQIMHAYSQRVLERKYHLYNEAEQVIDPKKNQQKAELLKNICDNIEINGDAKLDTFFNAHKVRAELKLKHWQQVKTQATEENVRRTKIKTIISVAYDISKIAIISMVIIGLFTSLGAMLPYILATGVVGLISNSFGWGKVLADDYNGRVNNPKIKPFAENYLTKSTYLTALA